MGAKILYILNSSFSINCRDCPCQSCIVPSMICRCFCMCAFVLYFESKAFRVVWYWCVHVCFLFWYAGGTDAIGCKLVEVTLSFLVCSSFWFETSILHLSVDSVVNTCWGSAAVVFAGVCVQWRCGDQQHTSQPGGLVRWGGQENWWQGNRHRTLWC